MQVTIFDIQRNSYVDGPGIRTTVFFKGCNLRCQWCHNPESQVVAPQILFYRDKCTGCGQCKGITPHDTDFLCFHDAKEICGRVCTTDEVLQEVYKDRAFYENSGGGVTFSGGECMLQPDALCEMLKQCQGNGIHTAVDTAGDVPWEHFARILPYTDLFLYDIKLFGRDKHQRYTGVDNTRLLGNLQKLLQAGVPVWIRIPVIGGVNDNAEEMEQIQHFLATYPPQKVELLPYHLMGQHKYAALGREAYTFTIPSPDKIEELRRIFTWPQKAQHLSHPRHHTGNL